MPEAIGPDLFRHLTAVAEPAVSPDGSRAAYTLSWIDGDTAESRTRIYQIKGADGQPQAFTQGNADGQPRYSPDGAALAFLRPGAPAPGAPVEEAARRQIWLMPSDGGEARQLTRLAEGVREFAWSPDATRLAAVSDVCPDADAAGAAGDGPKVRVARRLRYRHDAIGWRGDCHFHLFIVDAGTGQATQLTDGDWDDLAPAWSPEGRRIAFISGRRAERDVAAANEVYVVDAPETASPAADLPEPALPEPELWSQGLADVAGVAWSPDGRRLVAAGGTEAGLMTLWQAYLYILEPGQPPRRVTDDSIRPCLGYPGIYPTPELRWSAGDGGAGEGEIIFLGDAAGETRLYSLALPDGVPTALTGGGELLSGMALDRDAATAALAASGPATPSDLHRITIAREGYSARVSRRRVTAHNDAWLAGHPPAAMEKFAVPRGGLDIECRLYHPPDFDPGRQYPLLLEIHGGPNGAFYDSFMPWHQTPATNGYLVLAANPRGSSTYGEGFVNAVLGDWGGGDYRDLMAAVDAVCARAYVDRERLLIHGYSYGGYMTAWIIGHDDRFRAAVAGAPCIDLWSMYGTSDIGASFGEAQWAARPAGGAPATTPLAQELAEGVDRLAYRLLQRSPITFAPRVKTPTLLLHGEADARCPIGQSEQYFQALKRLGKEVELVRFPGCGHGFLRTGPVALREAYLQRMMDWFRRWLGE